MQGGHDARVPSSLRGGLLTGVPSSLHGGLLALVPSNQIAARTPLSMLNFDTVHIIQPFAILTCQLFFKKGLRWLLMCAPLLKLE